MQKEEIIAIAAKVSEGTADREEMMFYVRHIDAFIRQYPEWENLSVTLKQDIEEQLRADIRDQINVAEPAIPKTAKLWRNTGIAAAAAILLVVGVGLFFYTSYYAPRYPDLSRDLDLSRHLDDRRDLLDIAPGKNTATITLANGSTIVLSDAKTGVVVGAESLRYNDGSAVDANEERNLLNSTDKRSLPYGRDDGLGGDNGKGQYDGNGGKEGRSRDHAKGIDGGGSRNDGRGGLLTAATPRGGTYQITLPDGTKVWLNAASSLKFPASFAKLKDRRVDLVGEGYFEVAKDKAHPFIVSSTGQEVEVLGTHFNINSYADEASTKTTLLEGSVSVSSSPAFPSSRGKRSDENRALRELSAAKPLVHATSRDLSYRRDDRKGQDDGASRNYRQAGAAITLKPNQQAVLTANNQIKVVKVDAEQTIAWKNGDFIFRNEPIESIMKKVARWYDVEVIYQNDVDRKQAFGGEVSRSKNISEVLKRMQATGQVRFSITGKQVTVMK